MTTHTLILWSLTSAALLASICALFVAVHTSDRSLYKQLSGLSTRLKEAETTLDVLSAELKAERQRWAMRAYRARKNGAGPDEASEPTDNRDWVNQTNAQLALSRLGVRK